MTIEQNEKRKELWSREFSKALEHAWALAWKVSTEDIVNLPAISLIACRSAICAADIALMAVDKRFGEEGESLPESVKNVYLDLYKEDVREPIPAPLNGK